MAHGIKSASKLRIHQALHGYADGHRQLAASMPLDATDGKILLALSDTSGPGIDIGEDGYLTGYPLPGSKVYALAKTWTASEMPRPGCVWTHTLLVGFADFAALTNFDQILQQFRRPKHSTQGTYRTPAEVSIDSDPARIDGSDASYARQVLAALYDHPATKVIAGQPPSGQPEKFICALLAQQWPRLRRSFRFCTLAAADRSTRGAQFDLQMIASRDRGARTRFSQAVEAATVDANDSWLDSPANDLLSPETSGLRKFFRSIGSEVDDGRRSFRPLSELETYIAHAEVSESALLSAVRLFDSSLAPLQAKGVRRSLAHAAMKQGPAVSSQVSDFVFGALDWLDHGLILEAGGEFGRAVWAIEPQRILNLLQGHEAERLLGETTIKALSHEEVLNGLAYMQSFAPLVFSKRPDLLMSDVVWRKRLVGPEIALPILKANEGIQVGSVVAMIAAERSDLAANIAREMGIPLIAAATSAFVQTASTFDERVLPWIGEIANDTQQTCIFLTKEPRLSWPMLSKIAARLSPDTSFDVNAIDPWVRAVKTAAENERTLLPSPLAAYLLTRGLGSMSRNSAELIQMSFEPVHSALAVGRLPETAWSLLQPRLPWSFNWFEWDKCQRVRNAVADILISRSISSEIFSNICLEDDLFSTLCYALRQRGGWSYLSEALKWIELYHFNRYRSRSEIIRNVLCQ